MSCTALQFPVQPLAYPAPPHRDPRKLPPEIEQLDESIADLELKITALRFQRAKLLDQRALISRLPPELLSRIFELGVHETADLLPTLSVPTPLPERALGVFGLVGEDMRSSIGRSASSTIALFSPSLVSVRPSHFVVVVVVVVHEMARRLPLRLTGDWRLMGECEVLRVASARIACSSSLALSSRFIFDRCMVMTSDSGLMSKGWFSTMAFRLL